MKIIPISRHKDFDPVYRGVAYRIRDKQKLLNKSMNEFVESAKRFKGKDNEKLD